MQVKSYGDVLWFLAKNLVIDTVHNVRDELQKDINHSDVCTSRFRGLCS